MDECRAIDDVRFQSLGDILIFLNLSLGVILESAVSLKSALDEFPELFRERRVVQVVNSKTGSGCLGGVSWSDTLLGRTNALTAELNLLEAVHDLVEAEDEVRSVGDEESTGAVKALSLESVKLLEHGWRVQDETRADETNTLRVDQACEQINEGIC